MPNVFAGSSVLLTCQCLCINASIFLRQSPQQPQALADTSMTCARDCGHVTSHGHDLTQQPLHLVDSAMRKSCWSHCRYDVLLTANASVGSYWISSQPQYREGSPSGYAVLQYDGADSNALPTGATPQPESEAPWTPAQTAKVRMRSFMGCHWSRMDAFQFNQF